MYLVLKNCRANGKALKAGDVVNLDKETASTLVAIGRVEKTEVKEEPKKQTKTTKPRQTRAKKADK